jgi:hypothetical protein
MSEQPKQAVAVVEVKLEAEAVIAVLTALKELLASVDALRADVGRLIMLSSPGEFSETYRKHVG